MYPTPERSSMIDEIRRRAMSEEGLSDEDMAAYQARQEMLKKVAENEGGPAAIRAAMKPKRKVKQRRAQQGDVRKTEPSELEQMLLGRPTAVPASTAMRGVPMNNPLRQAAATPQEPSPDQIAEAMSLAKVMQALEGSRMAPPPTAAPAQEEMGMLAKLMQMLQGGGQSATMQAPQQKNPQQRWGGPQNGGVGDAESFLGRPMR